MACMPEITHREGRKEVHCAQPWVLALEGNALYRGTPHMEEGETTEYSVEMSEYSSKDSPDGDEEERE